MQLMKKWTLAASTILAYFTTNLYAQAPTETEFEITNGYRQDRIYSHINSYAPPTNLIFRDKLSIKDISYYQLGLRGNVFICEPMIDLGDLYICLETDYAWAGSGTYHEKGFVPAGMTSHTKARVHSGDAEDFIVGGGYLFDFNRCCGIVPEGFVIGPIAGWSYQRQKLKMEHATTNGKTNNALNGLTYTNRWQGPWLGFDATHIVNDFEFNIGYEYHWAEWDATWVIRGPANIDVAFSDRRKSENTTGQVFYLNGCWKTCYGLSLGLGVKYQSWHTSSGHEKPKAGSFAAIGLSSSEHDVVKSAGWTSFAATFDIGYVF